MTIVLRALIAFGLCTGSAMADGMGDMAGHSGDSMLFWHAGAEVDGADAGWLGDGSGTLVNWDSFAWYGGDGTKFRLEAEGDTLDADVGSSELRAMLSWNVSDFWDLQAGLREDLAPDPFTWGFVGFQGLAPYFFETEARLFVSENADFAFRLKQSFDILFTQDLILAPHVEANAYAQDIDGLGVGAGLATIEGGLQLRYEFSREFAPYLDLVHDRAVGETAIIARKFGQDTESSTLRLGLRLRL